MTDVRNRDEESINALTEKVIGAAYKVSNTLGCGFLEKVYENAMRVELNRQGLFVEQQLPTPVYYEGIVVGDYFADLVIERTVIVELKAVEYFADLHTAQCLNYLKATRLTICLLINFGKPRVEVKRLRM